MVKKTFYTVVLVLGLNVPVFAKLTSTVDRKTVRIDETLMLTIQNEQRLTRPPDLDGISESLQPLSQMQFSNISYKNGTRVAEIGWRIQLLALEEGVFTIPAFTIDNETTQPIQIKVLSAKQPNADGSLASLFSDIEISEINPFVQQQIILTVKVSSDADIDNAQLVPPQLDNALIRSLGEPTEFVSRLSGKLYRILEYKFSIFPQQEGLLEIPPMVFQGNKIVRYNSRNPLSLLSSQSRTVRLRTEGIVVDVKAALPSAHTWLPAAGLSLNSFWRPEPQVLTVGEPITRVLEIEAEGLDATQLPEFTMPEIEGISWFPNPAERENFFDGTQISSKLTQRFALMPNKKGHYQLPAIEINWYDNINKQFQIARIPAKEIEVNAAIIDENNLLNIPPSIQQTFPATENSSEAPQIPSDAMLWKNLSLISLGLWLLSLFAFIYYRNRNSVSDEKINDDTDHPDRQTQVSSNWKGLSKQIKGQSATAAYKLIKAKAAIDFKDFDAFIHFFKSSGNTQLAAALMQLSKDAFSENSQKGFDPKLCELLEKLPEYQKSKTSAVKKDKIAPLYD